MNRVREIVGVEDVHGQNIKGQGIGVAVLDTGVCRHPDFDNRLTAFYDCLHWRQQSYDDNGHGTHVLGIIGGSGQALNGKYAGIAPLCRLIGVKVLDQRGNGNVSDVIRGIEWIVNHRQEYNIRVINISVGSTTKKKIKEESALVQAVDWAWDFGLVVVVAAGNNGPKPMSISIPGVSRKVITVGSSDDNYCVEMFGNQATDYSGRGPTESCVCKPDVVAPGYHIMSCNANYKKKPQQYYTMKSGTSMATPVVSGAAALLLSKYPELTNVEVKKKIRDSALDLGLPKNQQGCGMLSIEKLLLST